MRVNVDGEATGHSLHDVGDTLGLDFWSELRVNAPVDVMVSPQNLDRLYHALDGRGIEHSVLIDDVQRLAESIKTADPGKMMSWDVYHPLEDMYEYMDYLEETFPESVSTEVIGQSYEGRDMRVIKICGGGECGKKPGMYIEGGEEF